jgi:hypothetical protein
MLKTFPCRFNKNLLRYDFDRELDKKKVKSLNATCFTDYITDNEYGPLTESCIILGNGPSLKNVDFHLLNDLTIFGSNRCYLGFKDWGRVVDHWFCTDRLQIEMYYKEYLSNIPDTVKMHVPIDYMTFFHGKNVFYINQSYDNRDGFKFSNNPKIFYLGNTVSYTMLQAAVMMGFKKIYLLGMDHNYPVNRGLSAYLTSGSLHSKFFSSFLSKFVPNMYKRLNPQTWTDKNTTGDTHFSKKYTVDKIFVSPRVELIEKAFDHARSWCDQNGIEVINITEGSKLNSFKRGKIEDLH